MCLLIELLAVLEHPRGKFRLEYFPFGGSRSLSIALGNVLQQLWETFVDKDEELPGNNQKANYYSEFEVDVCNRMWNRAVVLWVVPNECSANCVTKHECDENCYERWHHDSKTGISHARPKE